MMQPKLNLLFVQRSTLDPGGSHDENIVCIALGPAYHTKNAVLLNYMFTVLRVRDRPTTF